MRGQRAALGARGDGAGGQASYGLGMAGAGPRHQLFLITTCTFVANIPRTPDFHSFLPTQVFTSGLAFRLAGARGRGRRRWPEIEQKETEFAPTSEQSASTWGTLGLKPQDPGIRNNKKVAPHPLHPGSSPTKRRLRWRSSSGNYILPVGGVAN